MKDLVKFGNECIEQLNAIGIYPNDIEEFVVNKRAKRRWGQAKKENGKYYININVLLLDDRCSDSALRETVFHELLHCVDGCMNHGAKWQSLANLVNDCYNMNITTTSSNKEKLGNTEYANELIAIKESGKKMYSVVCTCCGAKSTVKGYRAPRWYAHPNNFYCSKCHSNSLKRVS